MKKVTFRKIFIKNFLSVGNEPLIISFKNGFNVISGINRDENNIKNGVGKTLIVDALYFAIFGETLREISKQTFVVNRQTKGRCEVKLAFSVENNGIKDQYIITRTLNDSSQEQREYHTGIHSRQYEIRDRFAIGRPYYMAELCCASR